MPDPAPTPDRPTPALADLMGRLARARGGDPAAATSLRAALDATPALWDELGDLAACAERSWIALAAGDDPIVREALARRLAALKAELAGPAAAPLELLLVDRVAATWLQVNHADAGAA